MDCNCTDTNTLICDAVTGACTCKIGWSGNNCETGYYCDRKPVRVRGNRRILSTEMKFLKKKIYVYVSKAPSCI